MIFPLLNMVIRNSGISPYLSAANIVTGTTLDVNIHCCVNPGTYCQTFEDPPIKNRTSIPRTLDAIALRPTGNAQGSYQFLDLNTWSRITRTHFEVIPMPQSVIDKVNTKGEIDFPAKKSKKTPSKPFTFHRRDRSIITSFDADDRHLLDEGVTSLHDNGTTNIHTSDQTTFDQGAQNKTPSINHQDSHGDIIENPSIESGATDNPINQLNNELPKLPNNDDDGDLSLDLSYGSTTSEDNTNDKNKTNDEEDMSFDEDSDDHTHTQDVPDDDIEETSQNKQVEAIDSLDRVINDANLQHSHTANIASGVNADEDNDDDSEAPPPKNEIRGDISTENIIPEETNESNPSTHRYPLRNRSHMQYSLFTQSVESISPSDYHG